MTLTDDAQRSAASTVLLLLPRLAAGDAPQPGADPELDGPTRQVAQEVVATCLRSANGAARAVQRLVPPMLELPDAHVPQFEDPQAAMVWYARHRSVLAAVVDLAAELGLDRECWMLAVELEALCSPSDDLAIWSRAASAGVSAARRLGDPRALAWTLVVSGGAHKMARRTEEAARDYREAIGVFERIDDTGGLALAVNRLGAALISAPDLDGASEQFVRVLALAEQAGNLVLAATATANLAYVEAIRGTPESAIRLGEQALALHTAAGSEPRLIASALNALVSICTVAGELGAAEEYLRVAVANEEAGADYVALRQERLIAAGELRLAQGLPDAAEAAFVQAKGLRRSDPVGEARAMAGLGRVLYRQGRAAEAIESLRAAAVLVRPGGTPLQVATVLSHLADALAGGGEHGQADEVRSQAALLLEEDDTVAAARLRELLAEGGGAQFDGE